MKYWYRLAPLLIPMLLLLGLMQLISGVSGPINAETLESPLEPEDDHNDGFLQWSQSIDSGERHVLLQWQKMPDPPYQLFLPAVLNRPDPNSHGYVAEGINSSTYSIFRREVGVTDWQMIGTSSPVPSQADMISVLGRDLADQLAWDLRDDGLTNPLSDQALYDALLSEQPKVQFASERFYQVDQVRGMAYMDRFAPLNQQLEYYVVGAGYERYQPIVVVDNATLPAPTGLQEVFPGPDELGLQSSTFSDDTEVRYRWDYYQKWREWDGSVSLYWETPTVDPGSAGGGVDSEDTIGMIGYYVYRAEYGSDNWQLINPVGDCQTPNQQLCVIPVRVSALPEGGSAEETFLFRDQLSDQFQNSDLVYQEWDYKVCAVDLLDTKSCSPRITAFGRDLNPPASVSGVQVDVPPGGPIQLSWTYSDTTEVSDPVRFYVTKHMTLTTPAEQWQAVYPDGSALPYIAASISQPVFITITDAPNKETPYWYQIQVRDDAGNFSPVGAPMMGAIYPRTAPPMSDIVYDDLNCQNNPLPLALSNLDSSIMLLNLYRGFTSGGPWSLVEQVTVANGSANIGDDYSPPNPIDVYYAIEAVDTYGNVSPPEYYCSRLNPGTVPPPPVVDTDLVYEGGRWYIPVGWTGEADSVEVEVAQPGDSGTASSTVSTTENPYPVEVNLGAWVETTVSGENVVGTGEGTTVLMHPTNNYLDTKRQMTDLGQINSLTWETTSDGDPAIRLDLSGVCDQCRSLPLAAVFRKAAHSSWLQVTPVEAIPRPSSDAPWIITDTADLSPNELYEYVVLAISPENYEVLGFWGSNKVAPQIPNQPPIQIDDPIADVNLWPSGCPYDGLRPPSAGMPEYVDLTNGWTMRVHMYYVGSSGCAPVTSIDPAHLYGDAILSNGSTSWTIEFANIGLDPATDAFLSGRIVHRVNVTIDETDRLHTYINRLEFTPGAAKAEVLFIMPEYVNIIHPDQGRSNEILFVANNIQPDFNFTTYSIEDLYMVDENLPWIVHYPRGAFRANKIGSFSPRYTSETIDRLTYVTPEITEPAIPDNNLAFMRPRFTSANAFFDRAGLGGEFQSIADFRYSTSFPGAVILDVNGIDLTIQESSILSGTLGSASARMEYLDQDTVKDYMLLGGRCTPDSPSVHIARCYETLDPTPPSLDTLFLTPVNADIEIGAGGVLSPLVNLDHFPRWTRYEVETRRGTLFVAAAVISGTETSWAPMPVENAWSQLPHPEGIGDLDPGLNINELSEPASYSCFTPAQFDWSVTDLYLRRGGVSEYFYTGEDLPRDRVNQYGYTEQVMHVELSLLDNTEEPVDYRTKLILPYPSEVNYPLTITDIDPENHCPARGDITNPTTAVHRFWEFEESPLSWAYLSALEKYGADIGSQEALFALEGTAVINGLNSQTTTQAGAPVVRTILSEWFPNGDVGDIQLHADDIPSSGYRVSGIKFNLSDVKLSRFYYTIMDESSLPDTLGIDLAANAGELPVELLDSLGDLTPASLKDCSIQVVDGCGFVLLDGDGQVDYFGEIQLENGTVRDPVAIPIDELAGAFPIATNEVISNAIQMVVDSPEVHWIWPAANLLVNNELQKYNIPVKFMGNTLGGALVGVLADASILPGDLPEIVTADLAATITIDWNDQRGYEDSVGIFAGYTASQAAFRALAMNRPQIPRAGIRPFDRWEDVQSDISKWAVDFGYILDPGPNNDEDDPVDLAELIWEEGWCRIWDPSPDDPDRECTDRVTDLAEIYDILEPMLQDLNGHEKYGPVAVSSGSYLLDANVKLSNGAGLVIFSPVGLNNLRFENFQFGTRMVIASEDVLRDAHLTSDWLHFDFTRDGQYIFQGTDVKNILVGEYGIRSDVLFIVDTRPDWEHVEGGIELRKFEVPYFFSARGAGVVGAGNYAGEASGFVGLRGEASTDDLIGVETEMSIVIVAGLLPTQSVVIDNFGFGDVLDKFGDDNVQGGTVPYTGAYFAMAGQWPLIDGTCLMRATGGGDFRFWYFEASNGDDKYGGQLEANLSATVACLISARGEVSLGFEKLLENDPVSPPPGEDPDWPPLPRNCEDPESCYALTGSVWLAVGVGYCSPRSWDSWSGTHGNWWGDDWCYTFGAMLGLSYLSPAPAGEDIWEYAADLKFE